MDHEGCSLAFVVDVQHFQNRVFFFAFLTQKVLQLRNKIVILSQFWYKHLSGLGSTVVQQFNALIHIFLQGLEADFDLGFLEVVSPLHPDHNIAENS